MVYLTFLPPPPRPRLPLLLPGRLLLLPPLLPPFAPPSPPGAELADGSLGGGGGTLAAPASRGEAGCARASSSARRCGGTLLGGTLLSQEELSHESMSPCARRSGSHAPVSGRLKAAAAAPPRLSDGDDGAVRGRGRPPPPPPPPLLPPSSRPPLRP